MEKLCRIIQYHNRRVSVTIEYSKIIDWIITITKRGTNEVVARVQSSDLDYAAAKAYTELCDWFSEEYGGY